MTIEPLNEYLMEYSLFKYLSILALLFHFPIDVILPVQQQHLNSCAFANNLTKIFDLFIQSF